MSFLSYSRTVVLVQLLAFANATIPTIKLGHNVTGVCRETAGILEWVLPPELITADEINLKFLANPTNEYRIPSEVVVISKVGDRDWLVNEQSTRFKGRIFNKNMSPMRFELENSLIHDRGTYRLDVRTTTAYYDGTIYFRVFAEDNLFPIATNENITSESGDIEYRYQFTQPRESPCVGVRMIASSGGIESKPQECHFLNESRCDIVFTERDLQGLSGTVALNVEPKYEAGTPACEAVEHHYSFLITIVPSKGASSGTVIYISVGAAAAVVMACLIPILVTRHSTQKNKRIPIENGMKFAMYCTGIIKNYGTNWRVLEGVYRANKPESQTQSFIELFQRKHGNLGEDYNEEQLLMSAAIKMFLKNEPTPWLPVDLQRKITIPSNSDMAMQFNVTAVRSQIVDTSSKKSRHRVDVMRVLFVHFKWLIDLQTNIQEQLREESKNLMATVDIVDLKGLSTCLSPNLFKEIIDECNERATPDMSPAELVRQSKENSQRQIEYVSQLIDHANEIFDTDANDTVVEADTTELRGLNSDNMDAAV